LDSFLVEVMITWGSYSTYLVVYSAVNWTSNESSHRTYEEEFPVNYSEYADNTAIIFDSRVEGRSTSDNCTRFGMELIAPRGDSKSVILFCSKRPLMSVDPVTFDNANISDVIIGNRYIPIVDSFTYLSSTISRDCSDETDA